MEIPRASLDQVVRAKDGRWVHVDGDVGGIVGRIEDLDPRLHVRWFENSDHYTVYELREDGREKVVLTTTSLDERVVKRLEQINPAKGYDVSEAMDKEEAALEKEIDDRFHQKVGDTAERLRHAMRKDLDYQDKVFIPERKPRPSGSIGDGGELP